MRGLKGVLVAACVCLSLLVGVCGALAAGDANHPNAGECPRAAEEAPGFASLPDCRRYEMVTPPQKNEATIGTAYGRRSLVARSGQRVIAPATQCFAGIESCVGDRSSDSTGALYAFARTSDGWVTHPLSPPASFAISQWYSVNADAGTALFSVPVLLGQEDFYARLSGGSFVAVGPLAENREQGGPPETTQEGVVATADLSHVVYETEGPVWSFDHTAAQQRAVYEYVGTGYSTPLMVGVSGGLGSTSLISTCGTNSGSSTGGASKHWGSLSEDGRTVYFTAEGHANNEGLCPSSVAAPPASEVYARIDGELPDARSILISGPTSAACTSEECREDTGNPERARDAAFMGASRDGSRVFFADTQQLTDGASEDPNAGSSALVGCQRITELGGCNLYESECPNGNRCAQPAERRLVDVSEGSGGAPVTGGPRVQGVLAMATDGSRVYFVAKGVLTAASNARGESAQEEADNLYVYSEGRLAFITVLSPSDEGQWTGTVAYLTANTTPDGRFLVFVSHRALTPDDTRAEGPAQVFEYDAVTRALLRISIGENGFNGNGNQGLLGRLYQDSAGGDASIVGASRTAFSESVPVSSDPTMSDDGAFVFFQSPVALTPGALNDVVTGCRYEVKENGKCVYGEIFASNVYEYHEGHVFLISDGRDTGPNPPLELLGSDASGANVFFSTYDRLVPEDTDTQLDIYDAHICSEREPCPAPKPAPAPCEGEACHGNPPGAPASQAPGSESLTGPGNLTPIPTMAVKPKTAARTRAMALVRALRACRRDRQKRSRVRCERQARAHSGSARKTNNGRAK
jgi:hypothetical protein